MLEKKTVIYDIESGGLIPSNSLMYMRKQYSVTEEKSTIEFGKLFDKYIMGFDPYEPETNYKLLLL